VLSVASELSIHAPQSSQKAGANADRDGSSPFADMVDSNTAQAETAISGAQTPQPKSTSARLIAGMSPAKSIKSSGIPAVGKSAAATLAAVKAADPAKPQQAALIPGDDLPGDTGAAEAADPIGTATTSQTRIAIATTDDAAADAQVFLDAIAKPTAEPAPAKKAAVTANKPSVEESGGKAPATPDSGTGAPVVPAAADPSISTSPPTVAVAVAIDVPIATTTDKVEPKATNAAASPALIGAVVAKHTSPAAGAAVAPKSASVVAAVATARPVSEPVTAAPPTAIDGLTQKADPTARVVEPAAAAIADVVPKNEGKAKAEKAGVAKLQAVKLQAPKLQVAVKAEASPGAEKSTPAPVKLPADTDEATAKAAMIDSSGGTASADQTVADLTAPAANAAQPKGTIAPPATPADAAKADSDQFDQQPQTGAPVHDAAVETAKAALLRHDQQPQQDATAAAKPTADALPPLTIGHANSAAAQQSLDKPNATASAAVPVSGLAVEITSKARDGKNSFDIRLDPPELGRIHVHLDVDRNGEITSHVIADRPDTLDLLRRDSSSLERALQDAGLKTANNGLQYSLRDQSFGRNDQPTQTAATTHLIASDETNEPMPPVYRVLAGARAGLDIRV
jgi:chemotaxis protein MotD